MNKLLTFGLCSSLLILTACGGGGGGSGGGNDGANTTIIDNEHLSGGTASVADSSADAFSLHSANLESTDKIQQFNLGNDFFQNPWVAGSASTSSRDGLGGLFNNNACQDCHIRDGRGHAPNVSNTEDGTDFSSILLRTARTDLSDDQLNLMAQSLIASVPDDSVGGQIQHQSTSHLISPEAELRVSYTPETVTFNDGHSVELRRPIWHITSLYNGYDFNEDTLFSARIAPPMIGLGLLALIAEEDILENEDPLDSNGDGISGRANRVWSIANQSPELGRFGWKAGQPSLLEQAAGAFVNDMGLTSYLHTEENCLSHQSDCLNADNGNGDSVNNYDYEVADTILAAIDFYSAQLAVPERRNAYGDQVQAGKALFQQAGCESCHKAHYQTQASSIFPELANQQIFPYTDLLLHDMGADLADFSINNEPGNDNQPVEFLASASEWRTPPLWGIGLAKTVDPEATFLHDGRARTLMEAILWHGGEAEGSKRQVLNFNAQQRQALIAFLSDL